MLSPKEAAEYLGVHEQTIRKWDNEGKIKSIRLDSNHRRFEITELDRIRKQRNQDSSRITAIYARVSSAKQKDDLERQINFLKDKYPDAVVFSDIASGLSYSRRPGFQSLLDGICSRSIKTVLCSGTNGFGRQGSDLVQEIAKRNLCEVKFVGDGTADAEPISDEAELARDVIAIITSYAARIHGRRKYGNKGREGGTRKHKDQEVHDHESDFEENFKNLVLSQLQDL